jgi:hypothetical protein
MEQQAVLGCPRLPKWQHAHAYMMFLGVYASGGAQVPLEGAPWFPFAAASAILCVVLPRQAGIRSRTRSLRREAG